MTKGVFVHLLQILINLWCFHTFLFQSQKAKTRIYIFLYTVWYVGVQLECNSAAENTSNSKYMKNWVILLVEILQVSGTYCSCAALCVPFHYNSWTALRSS